MQSEIFPNPSPILNGRYLNFMTFRNELTDENYIDAAQLGCFSQCIYKVVIFSIR